MADSSAIEVFLTDKTPGQDQTAGTPLHSTWSCRYPLARGKRRVGGDEPRAAAGDPLADDSVVVVAALLRAVAAEVGFGAVEDYEGPLS